MDNEQELKNEPGTADSDSLAEGNLDVESLRLSQDFAANIGVKKSILRVPVRKPDRQWFIQVHPDPDYSLQTAVIEVQEDRETYLVDRSLWSELPGEIIPKVLLTGINRQGNLFLWPIRLPGEDGRHDEWNASALEAAEKAQGNWVRVVANMDLGAYDVYEATGNLLDPEWPDIGFQELLEVAFKQRFIQDGEHPVLRRLRGDV